METFKPPEQLELSGNIADNWRRFKRRFDIYMDARSSVNKGDRTKTSILLYVIGESALELYNTFTFDIDDDSMKLQLF